MLRLAGQRGSIRSATVHRFVTDISYKLLASWSSICTKFIEFEIGKNAAVVGNERLVLTIRIQCPLLLEEDYMDQAGPLNVLFLCTGNSTRCIMAEAILNAADQNKFRAFSAGSHPTGIVDPFALEVLEQNHLSIEGLHSKDWNEFSRPGAPHLHFVFTVCDQGAAEPCPVWPGQPMTAHWAILDPAALQGTEEAKRKAFLMAFTELQRRILLFINLPFEALTSLALKEELDEIGPKKRV
jgi:arsenate reductase (thioredoxin)